jgi:hypothetical protein
MSQAHQPTTSTEPNEKRGIIRRSLGDITAELNSALVAASLACPLYLCIPTSGDALAILVSPFDPEDAEWEQIGQITCGIVARRIGPTLLKTRDLACGMAGTTMAGSELIQVV